MRPLTLACVWPPLCNLPEVQPLLITSSWSLFCTKTGEDWARDRNLGPLARNPSRGHCGFANAAQHAGGFRAPEDLKWRTGFQSRVISSGYPKINWLLLWWWLSAERRRICGGIPQTVSRCAPAQSAAPWKNVVDLKYTCMIKEYTKYTTFIQGGLLPAGVPTQWYASLSVHVSAAAHTAIPKLHLLLLRTCDILCELNAIHVLISAFVLSWPEPLTFVVLQVFQGTPELLHPRARLHRKDIYPDFAPRRPPARAAAGVSPGGVLGQPHAKLHPRVLAQRQPQRVVRQRRCHCQEPRC